MTTLEEALKQWDDPHEAHELPEAEDIIHMLRVEVAGNEAVIKALYEDLRYYRMQHKKRQEGHGES